MISQEGREMRARDDAKASNDFARVAAQLAILINGGAATAILALFSNTLHAGGLAIDRVFSSFPIALLIYSLGIFFAAAALPVGSHALALYMERWEGTSGKTESADRSWRYCIALIVLSLISFGGSSAFLALRLMTIVPK